MRLAPRLAALLLLATPLLAAPQAHLTNAKVETRSGAAGLSQAVTEAMRGRSGAAWIGWAVPTTSEGSSCCWASDDSKRGRCSGCQLEGREGWNGTYHDHDGPALEGGGRMQILLRTSAGRVGRVRAFSEGCPLDAGGLPFVWVEDVRAAESVKLLLTLVGEPKDGKSGKLLDDSVMAAIAAHDDPSADAALDRFVAPGQPRETRKQAAFWMGVARGAHGYQVLKSLVRDDADSHFREAAIFALSQSREPGAVDAILETAKRDPDGHVRGQALFWLAQTAARRAPDAIRNAIDDDPELEVKKKAVFALSQLPKDEGVPLLIGVAKSHRSYEVRKQAMFWLGQSHDPRALAFFEDVLKN